MLKQVMVVRTKYPDGKGGTVGIRTGKLAAQVAHASMKVFLDRSTLSQGVLSFQLPIDMLTWITGNEWKKVVLGVDSEEDLLRVYDQAQAAGLPAALIQDHGLTEFHGVPTNTVVALGPALPELIDAITGPSGTVKTRLL